MVQRDLTFPEESPEVVPGSADPADLLCRLETAAGLVADFALANGSRISGVILETAGTSTIVRLWITDNFNQQTGCISWTFAT